MKVSILLPFRNAAPWIEETIQSVLAQTHCDWELIAVNDHATDNTEERILHYDDSRIQIIQNEGKGIIPALQLAFSKATGRYTTRMDADDLMSKDKLAYLINGLSDKHDIVTSKVQYFSEGEVSEGYRKYENWLNTRCDKADHFDHIYRECVVASPNWLALTESLREDGIFEQLHYPEDYSMTFLWRKYDYHITSVNAVLHFWREHPERTSRNSEIYDQPSFFRLKLDWFRNSEKGKTLGIFGTGPKGKRVIEHLKNDFEIHWYDHAFEKYSVPVHGYSIEDPKTCNCDLLLLAVYPENKTRLENFVARLGYTFGKTVWYV